MLYRVQNDDSLSKIALEQLGNMDLWREIARLNNLAPPYIIHPNELILLPDIEMPATTIEIKKPIPKKNNTGWWIAAAGIIGAIVLGG